MKNYFIYTFRSLTIRTNIMTSMHGIDAGELSTFHVHKTCTFPRRRGAHTWKPLQTLNMNQAAAVDMYDLPNVGNGKFTR